MTRNLKLAALAAMALVAVGATTISGAQAGGEFHCSVEPCRFTAQPDDMNKTAHHVLVLRNVTGQSNAITCSRITGHGTSATKTVTEVTLTAIAYDGCTFVGQATMVKMNGCVYAITSHGGIAVECPEGKKIEWEVPGCKVQVSPQTRTGITFHNIGIPGFNTSVTVSALVAGVAANMTGTKAACGGVDPSHPLTGEYTTGNTVVSAETDGENPTFVDAWWAIDPPRS